MHRGDRGRRRPATRKINCGGPAYKDYQADLAGVASHRRPPAATCRPTISTPTGPRAEFGPEAAEPSAQALRQDRRPRCRGPSTWVDGPGGIQPDAATVGRGRKRTTPSSTSWPRFGRKVQGAGNLERFDYWLNKFRYLRAAAQVNCTWARFNAAIDAGQGREGPAERQKQLARDMALPIRKELVAQVAERQPAPAGDGHDAPASMGTVTNWQQHVMPMLLGKPGEELAKLLGEPLPADAMPGKDYAGPPRLFAPTLRTQVAEGESLVIRAIVLDRQPAKSVAFYHRPMGTGPFARIDAGHVARGVYCVTLPPAAGLGVEYYVQAENARWNDARLAADRPEAQSNARRRARRGVSPG